MTLWKLLVKGQQIQGVGFRERAAYAFNTLGIKGNARNIKETGAVEFLVLSDKGEESLRQVILGAIEKTSDLMPIARDAKIELILPVEDSHLENKLSKQEKFEVVREDDLHEMVWALQGAGNLFMTATKTINELLRYKKDERFMRLASIRCELAHAQNNIGAAKNLELVCLKDFIANPLVNIDAGKLQRFVDFYHEFAEFRAAPEGERKNELTKMSTKMDEMIRLTEAMEKNAKSS